MGPEWALSIQLRSKLQALLRPPDPALLCQALTSPHDVPHSTKPTATPNALTNVAEAELPFAVRGPRRPCEGQVQLLAFPGSPTWTILGNQGPDRGLQAPAAEVPQPRRLRNQPPLSLAKTPPENCHDAARSNSEQVDRLPIAVHPTHSIAR
eukprot:6626299-Alexandrium_andersonii.AAC.1